MKIKWIGKYDTTKPIEKVPDNYNLFIGRTQKNYLKTIVTIIFILIIVFISFHLKKFLNEVKFNQMGYYLGFLISFLFLLVHEYVHAIFLVHKTNVCIGWVPGGFFLLPDSVISRTDYLISLLAPAIVLGVIPLIFWIFIPFTNRTLSTLLFIFSAGNLGASTSDFINFFITLNKVPSKAFVRVMNFQGYWFI